MIILQPSIKLADPHMCSDAKDRLNIYTAIFDTLVRRDLEGNFVPMLAAGWQLDDDARTWTFTLRDDVVFHNGDRMNSADVVASFQRALSPEVGGELGTEGVWASYLGNAELSAIDPFTVRLVTPAPMADLLELLMAIPIVPQRTLPDLPATLVGSGPFRVIEIDDDQIVMARFDACKTREAAHAELIWRAEPDVNIRVQRWQAGDATVVTKLEENMIVGRGGSRAAPTSGQRLLTQNSNLVVTFMFNCSKGPGANKLFRQAVNCAINADRMITQALDGAATPLNGPLSPLHFGHDPSIKPYPHDPDKARALLAQAGVGNKLVVDLPTRLPDEAPLLGEMLAEDLAAVGIETELHFFEDRPAYAQRVKHKQINDLCCFDSSPLSTYRVLREKVNSEVAGPWWQGYDNPQVNALLDRAAATVDVAQRQAIYHEAYRRMHEDALWLFLYHPTLFWGVADGIASPQVSPEGLLRFEVG